MGGRGLRAGATKRLLEGSVGSIADKGNAARRTPGGRGRERHSVLRALTCRDAERKAYSTYRVSRSAPGG